MKSFRRILLIAALSVTFFAVTESQAGTVDEMARKLGRGVCNVGFGVFEIPIKVWDVNGEEGGTAALTFGVFKGLAFFIGRELVGVTEIVTFPLPLPDCPTERHEMGWGYGPIMYPEWVFDIEHNIFNFIYPETEIIQ